MPLSIGKLPRERADDLLDGPMMVMRHKEAGDKLECKSSNTIRDLQQALHILIHDGLAAVRRHSRTGSRRSPCCPTPLLDARHGVLARQE